jgi:hypothetical protein
MHQSSAYLKTRHRKETAKLSKRTIKLNGLCHVSEQPIITKVITFRDNLDVAQSTTQGQNERKDNNWSEHFESWKILNLAATANDDWGLSTDTPPTRIIQCKNLSIGRRSQGWTKIQIVETIKPLQWYWGVTMYSSHNSWGRNPTLLRMFFLSFWPWYTMNETFVLHAIETLYVWKDLHSSLI